MNSTFILVDRSVAPEVFVKVVEAKKNLASGKFKTINEALSAANVSRSAFYKYKNNVFAHTRFESEQIVTLFFTMEDIAGILSDILILLSSAGANILTINQNIPVNHVANVTISMRTEEMSESLDSMIERLKSVDGVNKLEILSM